MPFKKTGELHGSWPKSDLFWALKKRDRFQGRKYVTQELDHSWWPRSQNGEEDDPASYWVSVNFQGRTGVNFGGVTVKRAVFLVGLSHWEGGKGGEFVFMEI